MLLRHLFEAPNSEVAIIFGRFNPPHKGHRAAWEMASQSPVWFVGTNKSTVGPKDPLPFDVKVEAMKTIWPEVEGHIVAETSWLTLASEVYKKYPKATLLCLTDEEWVTKTIIQYNGKEGPHGFYNFKNIEQKPTPRLSSATALRDAVAKGDRDAFSQAAGVSADTKVAGKPFFDLVAEYLLPYQNAPKKAAKKKKETEVAEAGTKPGWMLKQDPKLAAKVKAKTDLAKKRQASHGDKNAGKSVKENLSAEEYKQKLLATLPDMMRFYEKNVRGWKPSKEQMLAAVETGYTVMKHTGDVKQAGKAVMDELNTLHRMSQGQQGAAEDISRRGLLKGIAGAIGGLGVVGAANQLGKTQNLDAENVTTVNGEKYMLGRPSLGAKLDGKTSAGKYKLVKDDKGNIVYIWNDVRTAGGPTRFVKKFIPVDQVNEQGVAEGSLEEYGDTKKGQKMLTKVQKRAVDRMIKADDKRDAKAAKKNQDTANRAWDRMTDVEEEKQKGVDGKACWDGYKRMGTKKKGGKTVDNCVKVGEDFNLKNSLQELSNDMLGRYKKAASADATKADKAGNFKKGDKRFSGIVKATKKQFDNDIKGKK